MRILVLTKRQYMAQDLLDDRFGRFRELSLELARLGHEVRGLCLSYRRKPEGAFIDGEGASGARVSWHSSTLLNGLFPALRKYPTRALALAREFQPDVIWACSDAYHAIFGSWLAGRARTRCVIDLYDNFEAFRASQIPGILSLFRRSVREAEGVTCFSARLADYIARAYPRSSPIAVIENGVRTDLFYKQDRISCRQALGLPQSAKIIGTAGALDRSRGVDTLFRSFEMLAHEDDEIHLALAGPRKRSLRTPNGPRVHDLQILPHRKVPCFINALDLAVICYRDSAQGRYSFPQKAYEIMACRVPLVAASVGTMQDLLQPYPASLFEPENPENLASTIRQQLKNPTLVELSVPTWRQSAAKLADFFADIKDGKTHWEA